MVMGSVTKWIAGITRGHNGSTCLLKDGEIVFFIEEERLSRYKHDGTPLLSLQKCKDYTDQLDYLVISHTQPLSDAPRIDFAVTGAEEDIYTSFGRKTGLIDDSNKVIDYSRLHHKLHAACAFYRSGFETATALIVDGAGFAFNNGNTFYYETESIFECSYPAGINTLYKHLGGTTPTKREIYSDFNTSILDEDDHGKSICIIDGLAGLASAYLAVNMHLGFHPLDCGKTMGLASYGKSNDDIPSMFYDKMFHYYTPVNSNFISPVFPPGGVLIDSGREYNREDLAYKVQQETQDVMTEYLKESVDMTGNYNIVLSGGYALNCVANYHYLEQLKDEGINLYVEPISNDAGTSMGAALYHHYKTTGDRTRRDYSSPYLGPEYSYDDLLSLL